MPQDRGRFAKPSATAALASQTFAWLLSGHVGRDSRMVRNPWLVTLLLYTLAGVPGASCALDRCVSRKNGKRLALFFLISVHVFVVSGVYFDFSLVQAKYYHLLLWPRIRKNCLAFRN